MSSQKNLENKTRINNIFIIYSLVCYLLLCFIVGLISSIYNIISGGFGFKERLEIPKYMKIGFYIDIIIILIIIVL